MLDQFRGFGGVRHPLGEVALIVVHNISLLSNAFGGPKIANLFLNRPDCDAHPYFDANRRGVRASAHFVIHRDSALEQSVSCGERCNDFAIGIELEGSDTTAFGAAQYTTLAALVKALVAHYPIEALAGHSDIAPGRKIDPERQLN